MYFLYRAEANEFRFCWARDEARRLSRENPTWRERDSVALKFGRVLDPPAIGAICERILDESQRDRKIRDTVDELAAYGPVRVEIDVGSGMVTSPPDSALLLRNFGNALVSSGQHRRVLELGQLLLPKDERDPKVQLALGYACFASGEYLRADAHLSDAEAGGDSLDPADRGFLHVLRDTCEYTTGRIDIGEYQARQDLWSAGESGATALHYEMLSMRTRLFSARHGSERAKLGRELLELKARVDAHPGSLEGLRLRAELMGLEAEALGLAEGFMRLLLYARVGGALSAVLQGGKSKMELLASWLANWISLEARFARLLVSISESVDFHLLCDALLARAGSRMTLVTSAKIVVMAFFGDAPDAPTPPMLHPEDIDQAETLAREHGFRSEELRAMLDRATLLALNGEESKSRDIAKSVLDQARVLRLVDFERLAELHCSPEGYLGTLVTRTKASIEEDQDRRLARTSDEDILAEARDGLLSMRLPPDRLPILLNDYRATRAVSRERVEWCRHIGFMQDLQHTFDRATLYAREPERVGHCEKFGIRSRIPQEDWGAVLVAFKRAYCDECAERSPKGSEPTGTPH
ncbi:MAG: hypothetical protein HY049_13705 [Acidobacteria bacterium]|nr:hypothetical protein [Acidobacteriota bacterium]